MVPELVACHNLGWTAANVPEWSVPVVEESSGELEVVKAPGPLSVVSDEFLSQLDPHASFRKSAANSDPWDCILYTSPSPRDGLLYRMPSSA